MTPAYLKAFRVTITVHHRPQTTDLRIVWTDLRFELRMKYAWYFRYRAALLQVQYPKSRIDLHFSEIDPSQKIVKDAIATQIRAKRITLGKYRNKLQLAREHWSSIFPIDEDPLYIRAAAKVARLASELESLESQL